MQATNNTVARQAPPMLPGEEAQPTRYGDVTITVTFTEEVHEASIAQIRSILLSEFGDSLALPEGKGVDKPEAA